jgi:hypothetical protein
MEGRPEGLVTGDLLVVGVILVAATIASFYLGGQHASLARGPVRPGGGAVCVCCTRAVVASLEPRGHLVPPPPAQRDGQPL